MNRLIAAAGAVVLIAGGAFFLVTSTAVSGSAGSSASAADDSTSSDCTPQPAVAAVFGDWQWDRYTDWQTTDTQPADPDSQAGEDNPLNLVQIGAEDTRQVVDVPAQDAYDEVTGYIKWTYNPAQSAGDLTPAFDPADPHWNKSGDQNKPTDVTAGEIHQSDNGNGSWFYWQPITAHHDAVPAVTHTEYRWSVDTRTYTPGQDAVECPGSPGSLGSPGEPGSSPSDNPTPGANHTGEPSTTHTENPHATPTQQTGVTHPQTPTTPTKGTPDEPRSTQTGHGSVPATTVPTVIDAGL